MSGSCTVANDGESGIAPCPIERINLVLADSWERAHYFRGPMTCDVLEVQGDNIGNYCPRISVSQCSECGLHLCDEHTAKCDLCGDTFCTSCLYHHTIDHSRPRQIERLDRIRKHA